MAGMGMVFVQLLQALGETTHPPAWVGNDYTDEHIGVYPGVPPLHVPIWNHSCYPGGGAPGSRPGATHTLLYI